MVSTSQTVAANTYGHFPCKVLFALSTQNSQNYLGNLFFCARFHAVGWTFPWSIAAVRGTNICLRKIDYPFLWHLLQTEGITHFNAAPTVNTLLCADSHATRLPSPVHVTVAASPPTPHLFAQMTALNLLPVHVYGMTETYGPITKGYILPSWGEEERFRLMARQGHGFVTSLPVRVVKHREDDEDNNNKESALVDVARDGKEIGEIVFVGNICAKGYYKDPEATRKLFAGGALHSGDLAVWHPDGSVQILDRAKDIIISGKHFYTSLLLLKACSCLCLFVLLTSPKKAAKIFHQWLSKVCSSSTPTFSKRASWLLPTHTGASDQRRL